MGPTIDLCGSPNSNVVGFDKLPAMSTWEDQPERYDWNQDKTVDLTPVSLNKRDINIWWSIVSNAADRSKSTIRTTLFESMANIIFHFY